MVLEDQEKKVIWERGLSKSLEDKPGCLVNGGHLPAVQ